MNFEFKKFEQTNIRLENRITITKSNTFGFPTKFSEDNNIKSFKYVVLFYDKKSNAIGIHFTNDEEEKNKFSIIKYKKYGASIIATSFFKLNSIDTKKYHGRYHWKIINYDNVGKLYVIKLNDKNFDSG
jgi:hypothetical protein